MNLQHSTQCSRNPIPSFACIELYQAPIGGLSQKNACPHIIPWTFYLQLVITFNLLTTCLLYILPPCWPQHGVCLLLYLYAVIFKKCFSGFKTPQESPLHPRESCSDIVHILHHLQFVRIVYILENVLFIREFGKITENVITHSLKLHRHREEKPN